MARHVFSLLRSLSLGCLSYGVFAISIPELAHADVLYRLDTLSEDAEPRLFPVGLEPRPDYTGQIVGDLLWLNRYTVQSGGEQLDSVSLSFGAPSRPGLSVNSGLDDWQTGNYPITVLLYGDPNNDGNPIDAQLLAQADTVLQNPDTTDLTQVNIVPTTLDVGQNFFVGALFRNLERGQRPATVDLDAMVPDGVTRSWFAIGNHGDDQPSNIDIQNLANNFRPGSATQSPVPLPSIYGSWVIRANGKPVRKRVPEASVVWGVGLTLGLALWYRRRRC